MGTVSVTAGCRRDKGVRARAMAQFAAPSPSAVQALSVSLSDSLLPNIANQGAVPVLPYSRVASSTLTPLDDSTPPSPLHDLYPASPLSPPPVSLSPEKWHRQTDSLGSQGKSDGSPPFVWVPSNQTTNDNRDGGRIMANANTQAGELDMDWRWIRAPSLFPT